METKIGTDPSLIFRIFLVIDHYYVADYRQEHEHPQQNGPTFGWFCLPVSFYSTFGGMSTNCRIQCQAFLEVSSSKGVVHHGYVQSSLIAGDSILVFRLHVLFSCSVSCIPQGPYISLGIFVPGKIRKSASLSLCDLDMLGAGSRDIGPGVKCGIQMQYPCNMKPYTRGRHRIGIFS